MSWNHPMTFGEVLKSEEVEIVNVAEIKVRCYEFAVEVCKTGIYKPGEVLDKAKEIFDWVMDNEAFKNQS